MNFVIHRERGGASPLILAPLQLKTCRTLSIHFPRIKATNNFENSPRIGSIHKHQPNKQTPFRQHVIHIRSCDFSPG